MREYILDHEIINNLWRDYITWRARIRIINPNNLKCEDDDEYNGFLANMGESFGYGKEYSNHNDW